MEKTKKVAYSNSYGGLSLSNDAKAFLRKKGMTDPEIDSIYSDRAFRDDPRLIECLEKLGPKANDAKYGKSDIRTAEIKSGDGYRIVHYDGMERVVAVPGIEEFKAIGTPKGCHDRLMAFVKEEEKADETVRKPE